MKKQYDDDDGRTIADMSSLERRSVVSGVMTGLALDRKINEQRTSHRAAGKKAAALNKEERRMYTFGAMGAGLLIGLIFLAVFAAAIVLILLLAGKL